MCLLEKFFKNLAKLPLMNYMFEGISLSLQFTDYDPSSFEFLTVRMNKCFPDLI